MNYAYWRRPDGKPHRGGDGKHAPSSILAGLSKDAKVRGEQISWTDRGLRESEVALTASVIVFDPDGRELNEDDSSGLILGSLYEVIRKVGGETAISPEQLLRSINKRAAQFYRTTKTTRTLVTSLSIADLPSATIEVEGLRIVRASRLDYPYPDSVLDNKSFVSAHVERTQYRCVAVEVEAGTISQAFDSAISAINLLRGVWNLLVTFKTAHWRLSVYPRRTWIGKVHIGPIHTLHRPDGALETDLYWHEPDYLEDAELFNLRGEWERIEKGREHLCHLISVSPFKQDLVQLITRYAVALDQGNLDVSFLMLWSLLERITDTVGANYDLTIERAIAMYLEPEICRQILNQMRNRRNQFVHSARSAADRDQFCYSLKSFVDGHLMELVNNNLGIKSLAEYGQFLSLPRDIKRLSKLRDWYSLALTLRTRRLSEQGLHGEGI